MKCAKIYKLWRPTPLLRARRLENALDTPAHIYYKYEGVSPSGSHKLNTADRASLVQQAGGHQRADHRKPAPGNGARHWRKPAASSIWNVSSYMVRISYEQKPYRRAIMQSFGAGVTASPSDSTNAGRTILEADPDSTGSLGIAISEAVEVAATSGGKYKYSLGSVLNHVLMHQTVIGQEALAQMDIAGEYPDVVVGPTGGGSNFAGIALPFLHQNLTAGKSTKLLGVEPAACPSLTRGVYAYDFGDTVGMTPLLKMYTLGHGFVPPPLHAGGSALSWHGFDHLRALGSEAARHGRYPTAGDLRRRHHIRQSRGHHRRAGSGSWHRRGDPRGAGGKGSGRRARHPLQPLRARALRHERL